MPPIFLPLHFTTPCCIVHAPVLHVFLVSRLRFAFPNTPTIAQTCSSHSFTLIEDLPSATPTIASFNSEDCHLSHFSLKTCAILHPSTKQLPLPSLAGMWDFTLAESTIPVLLGSLVHAMSIIGKAIEKLRLQISQLEAYVANSLPSGIDIFTQLNQIQSSLWVLSHRFAHLLPLQVAVPTPSHSCQPGPSTVSGPRGRLAKWGLQQHQRTDAIVRSDCGWYQRVRQSRPRSSGYEKNKKGKINPTASTMATKVTAANKEASHQKAPPRLASAAGRPLTPRTSPALHPDASDIKAHLPDLDASLLRDANCALTHTLKAIVKDRCSVTLIVADTTVRAAFYAPYFEALTTKINNPSTSGQTPASW